MIKILFLIHSLVGGGAEKVLVNLVNNMDRSQFDISVMALFGGGVNEKFLKNDIKFHSVFPKIIPGNSKFMKLLNPQQLHKLWIKEKYDIEVSYLEGPSARVISGCPDPSVKLVSWIHVEQHTMEKLAESFRNAKEAQNCYNKFTQTVCVSEYVKKDFIDILNFKKPCQVLYNTVEYEKIVTDSKEIAKEIIHDENIKLIAVGTLKQSKGYDRLFNIINRFINEKYNVHLYVLGVGPLKNELENYIENNHLEKAITLLGYNTNPYKYIANSDLFVCASYAEGFSTAATEALILGTPVCTVDVSGMKEMLGENNEYGVVTKNNEEELYFGIKRFLDNPEELNYFKNKAAIRGKCFSTEQTVMKVEEMFEELMVK